MGRAAGRGVPMHHAGAPAGENALSVFVDLLYIHVHDISRVCCMYVCMCKY